jgi:outer membrane receptor for ferrienterochelin and colicins
MNQARRAALAFALALPAAALGAGAQSECQLRLQRAQGLYQEGRLAEVPEALAPCFNERVPRAERVQAYALTAKAELADDRPEAAETAVRALVRLEPGYQPDLFDPPRFAALVAAIQGETVVQVTSVSKSRESLREAPATVYVVTREQIRERGYLDLEAPLHDLPGFDISRAEGFGYSNIYQRGYRSDETNRTLFLIDGVEENDLASNGVWLSRQYPLSSVERIEVVHGPASTIYGANAFAGVINVVTADPLALLPEGRSYAVHAQVAGGEWNTQMVDATAVGKTPDDGLRWSVTGRLYRSDGFDLSGYEDWDYDPGFYDRFDYRALASLRLPDPERAAAFLAAHPGAEGSGLFEVVRGPGGEPTAVRLSEAGAARARALDQAAFAQTLGGEPIGFSDPVDDWYVEAKLQTANLTAGFRTWRQEEGATPWLTDRVAPGGDNGLLWTPEYTSYYLRYTRPVTAAFSFSLFSNYKQHELDGDSSAVIQLRSYAGGGLRLADLFAGTLSGWNREFNSRSNTELQNEVSVLWDPSEKLDLVAGFEVRNSSVGATNVTASAPDPAESGSPSGEIPGGNDITSRDLGLYTQLSYRPLERLRLVLGARLDDNQVRDTEGYGTVFNPRLAVIYTWGGVILKAIYSEAFEDPPNFQKYQTVAGVRELANPALRPEEARNFELSAGWAARKDLWAELAYYEGRYSELVEQVDGVPCPTCATPTTGQFQNVGGLTARGVNAWARLDRERWSLEGNYTFTDSENSETGVPVGDIADHQANLLGGVDLRPRLGLHLRANYVGARRTGPGTTVASNPFRQIDDFLVVHGTLTFRDLLGAADLQLVVNNLFDTEHFHPGVRSANGTVFAARIPQPGRAVFLRLLATF